MRVALQVQQLSFSFHRQPIKYKDQNDNVPTSKAVEEILKVIRPYADEIMGQGYANDLTQRFKQDPKNNALINEVDDIVLTVWIYDIIYEFKYIY